jgi:hypothetical protein
MKCLQRFLLLTAFVIIHKTTESQTSYTSSRYNYYFEIPKDFHFKQNVIGRNVDLAVLDQHGSSINIVVKDIPRQYQDVLLDQMAYASKEDIEASKRENFDNPHLIKHGLSNLNGEKCYYERYTFDAKPEGYTMYNITYSVLVNGKLFLINASCENQLIGQYEAVFFRAFQSFKIQ